MTDKTNEANETDEIDFDLFALALACAQRSRQLSELLTAGVTQEALFLTRKGFVVPAPTALAHLAGVLAGVSEMLAQTPLRFEDAKSRLDQICAFATALNGIGRDFDMAWSSLWVHALGEGMPIIESAATSVMGHVWAMHFCSTANKRCVGEAAVMVLNTFNAGSSSALQARMVEQLRQACEFEGWTR